ncbi:hypothetical protein POPTR_008G036350v4 [Populus trichocarpa]|uniref:Uncharacterized protein n=1 Tax=Populus trichocarpa TaxID=3694 RepID=A0ACC0SJF9_POPTR|nr:hypothetical protein BDE02_08G031800 [Populus trichocarpa]KAI9389377.1 hypothetical protein POPTR_008G036350v4 [Populus trichocarpa]
MEKASFKLAILIVLIFSTTCFLQQGSSVQATEITAMKGMPCASDDVCIPFCPKSCKRIFCNQKRSSANYHMCYCENSSFSPQQMLIAIPCVTG